VSVSLFRGSLEANQRRESEDFGQLVAVKVTHLDYSTSIGACAKCYFWWKRNWRSFARPPYNRQVLAGSGVKE